MISRKWTDIRNEVGLGKNALQKTDQFRAARGFSTLALIAFAAGTLASHPGTAAAQDTLPFAIQEGTQIEVSPMNSLEGSLLSWVRLRESLKNKVIAPFAVAPNGRQIALPLESVSPDLRVSRSSAEWTHDGKNFRATLTESPESDGGDLWNLTIEILDPALAQADWKPFARAENVPAFGDVLLAIFGGRSEHLTPVLRN